MAFVQKPRDNDTLLVIISRLLGYTSATYPLDLNWLSHNGRAGLSHALTQWRCSKDVVSPDTLTLSYFSLHNVVPKCMLRVRPPNLLAVCSPQVRTSRSPHWRSRVVL
jgi:hypothetical protein